MASDAAVTLPTESVVLISTSSLKMSRAKRSGSVSPTPCGQLARGTASAAARSRISTGQRFMGALLGSFSMLGILVRTGGLPGERPAHPGGQVGKGEKHKHQAAGAEEHQRKVAGQHE